MLNLIPEHDYVFIKHTKVKQTKMASGIIITEVQKHTDTLSGEVAAVNPNCSRPLSVKEGDIVYFTETDVKSRTMLDGQEYLVVSELNILAILDK